MADPFKDADFIDPSNIVVPDEEDQEYLYDLRKKQADPRRTIINSVKRHKKALWALALVVLLHQVCGLFVYRTYPYYSSSASYQTDDDESNLVSISYEEIQHRYYDQGAQGKGIDWGSYAYVSYATNLNYLCSSLMVFEKLKNRYGSKADMLLFYSIEEGHHALREDYKSFQQTFRATAEELNVRLVPISSLQQQYHVTDLNFESSFRKLEIFQFEKYKQYVAKYKKLIYIDSDVHLNDKLDELFFIPDEFDVAMPLAYWLLDPAKNYKNLLSQYPASEPSFAPSGDRGLNYFRIQSTKDSNLKWSTALMVIKPSAKLNEAINEELFYRLDHDYDMDIINKLFERPAADPHWGLRKLTLPHKPYFAITGDLFLSPENRHYYLADPIDMQFVNKRALKKCGKKNRKKAPYWCRTDTAEDHFVENYNRTKVVHFSDYPLPKPWVQSYIKVTCSRKNGKPGVAETDLKNTIVVDNCDDYNAWGHFHNTFIRDRLEVCRLHQEVEEY